MKSFQNFLIKFSEIFFLKSDERNRARVFPSSQEISQIQCIISIWDLGQILLGFLDRMIHRISITI